MDPAQCVVRRANVDDLAGLKLLWERAGLQVLDVERHLTEFQLIASLEGDLIGAVALRHEGKQGWLHSEAFVQPEHEDAFRPLLWQRVQNLARNHGLVRIWTLEEAPFWHREGFVPADQELVKKLPRSFGSSQHHWRVLVLHDEVVDKVSLEHEFEMFQQASRASMEDVIGQARRLRSWAYTVGIGIFVVVLVLGGYLLVRWMQQSGGSPRRRAEVSCPGGVPGLVVEQRVHRSHQWG